MGNIITTELCAYFLYQYAKLTPCLAEHPRQVDILVQAGTSIDDILVPGTSYVTPVHKTSEVI